MKEKYLCIDPDGTLEWIWLDVNPEPGYCSSRLSIGQLWQVLDSSFFEQVRTIVDNVVMLIDDCGAICVPPKPVNELASRFYLGSAFGNMIHGRAILFREGICNSIGERDLFPLDEWQLPYIRYLLGRDLPSCDFTEVN